ncbi:MAG: hypothetical protein LUF81_07100 [Clostridiales bacterium]|nr:hypothetical protein [Clostridiales bacterium]
MTTNYEKPVILFESFVLSQSIADNCGVPGGGTTLGKPNHSSKTTCGWDMGNVIVWLESMTNICSQGVSEDTDVGGYCYNTPSNGYTIFSS